MAVAEVSFLPKNLFPTKLPLFFLLYEGRHVTTIPDDRAFNMRCMGDGQRGTKRQVSFNHLISNKGEWITLNSLIATTSHKSDHFVNNHFVS